MHAVFDAPVAAPPGQKLTGIGSGARDARDGVFDLALLLAVTPCGSRQTADLLDAGPIEMTAQAGRGLQSPLDVAAMFLRLGFRYFDGCFT
jgi:hypothetical protein